MVPSQTLFTQTTCTLAGLTVAGSTGTFISHTSSRTPTPRGSIQL